MNFIGPKQLNLRPQHAVISLIYSLRICMTIKIRSCLRAVIYLSECEKCDSRAKLAYVSGQRLLDAAKSKRPEFVDLRAELQLELEQCQYQNPNCQKQDKSK